MNPPGRLPTPHCSFRVGDHRFGMASSAVAEVLRDGRITRVPRAPDAVRGLLHIRGRIVPVIDMRRWLGIAAEGEAAAGTHVVLRIDHEWYSLLVDEMLDVIDVDESRVEHPTRPAADAPQDAVTGVLATADGLVHLLDPRRILLGLGDAQPAARSFPRPPGSEPSCLAK